MVPMMSLCLLVMVTGLGNSLRPARLSYHHRNYVFSYTWCIKLLSLAYPLVRPTLPSKIDQSDVCLDSYYWTEELVLVFQFPRS
ncbi:hypothetical protein F5Y18DRAFT_309557 [Xylariaceae sp. FL1019]|nr:hypothetical protein F5Y18DRAFT_309557 [Xylariaceae sp. FL1019]